MRGTARASRPGPLRAGVEKGSSDEVRKRRGSSPRRRRGLPRHDLGLGGALRPADRDRQPAALTARAAACRRPSRGAPGRPRWSRLLPLLEDERTHIEVRAPGKTCLESLWLVLRRHAGCALGRGGVHEPDEGVADLEVGQPPRRAGTYVAASCAECSGTEEGGGGMGSRRRSCRADRGTSAPNGDAEPAEDLRRMARGTTEPHSRRVGRPRR